MSSSNGQSPLSVFVSDSSVVGSSSSSMGILPLSSEVSQSDHMSPSSVS